MTRFREIGRNFNFWAKKGIFGPKLAQNGPNGIFWAKSENVTSVALGYRCEFIDFRSLSQGTKKGKLGLKRA